MILLFINVSFSCYMGCILGIKTALSTLNKRILSKYMFSEFYGEYFYLFKRLATKYC